MESYVWGIKITILWCCLFFSLNILFCQTSHTEETNLTNHISEDRYASYSPDGKNIVFESNRDGNWNIFIMSPSGEIRVRITEHDSSDRQPVWHPNGKKILFQSNRTGKMELFEFNIRNGKLSMLNLNINQSGKVMFPSYGPNGRSIFFSYSFNRNHSAVYSMCRNGKKLERITTNEFRNHFPRSSPDASSIIFFSRMDSDNEDDEIYQYHLASKKITRLTNWPKHNFCPSYSNDGNRIAYVTSMEQSRPEIFIMDSNGENQKRLTYNDQGETLPSWSPDDTHLLVTAYRNGNYEICKLTLSDN